MADCSTLLDEELESFVFNYLTDSPVPGEESLLLDFPEIDLSPLDGSDFDTNNCFNELQWCNDQSEYEPSQYSTDDSELFQITDSENETLLAALTQTLDDIQEDDLSLSAFISLGDGDFYPIPALSPKPSHATESSKSLETEDELSILKKLLLTPAQMPTGSDPHNDSSARHQGTSKFRSLRQCLKVESSTEKQTGIPQAQGRCFTELQRHLVSAAHLSQSVLNDCSQVNKKEEESDSNEEQSEDESGSNSLQPSLQNNGMQFTCEEEKRAVVELIGYMHTYCLPPKKHNNGEKHQHSNSVHKRSQLVTFLNSCSDQGSKVNLTNVKKDCLKVNNPKYTKLAKPGNSILKELLAKEICVDVSKPYRLALPVYAAFSDMSRNQQLQGKSEQGLGRVPKPDLEKINKPYLTARKESRFIEADFGKQIQSTQEQTSNKSTTKQECSVYAVRRSSRLNSKVCYADETLSQTCMTQKGNESQLTVAQNFRLTRESFVDEEQVSEIEVDESFELNRSLQDLEKCDQDILGAHIDNIHLQYYPLDNPECPASSLSQTSSTFEKRNFEQELTVELCGTAGLTPPTTPPYKPAEEDLYKPDIRQETVHKVSINTSSFNKEETELYKKFSKKQPQRSELYAHLCKTEYLPDITSSQGVKRPFSRSFGDHDYCQVIKAESGMQRKVLKSLDQPSYTEKKQKPPMPTALQREAAKKSIESSSQGRKLLKDHEIRASLTKHFGYPDNTVKEEKDINCNSSEYDSVFDDSESECSSAEDEACLSPFRKSYSQRRLTSKVHGYTQSQTTARIIGSPNSRRTHRYERSEHCLSQRKRQKAINEGRVVYIKNLSGSISDSELKRRFEVFGEITECHVLSRNGGEKNGFIIYQHSEDAALSLKKGPSLRKRNEPSFHMSYAVLQHFSWTKYTDLDSNKVESSPTVMKSKYEPLDFDSLLKEAQRSLHR